MYRWEACPGSVRLNVGVPGTTSVDAEKGTIAHDWLAKCLLGEASLGQIPKEDGMRDAVQVAFDSIRSQMVTAGVGAKKEADRGFLFVEQKLDLSSVYPTCFGTGDVLIYDKKRKKLTASDYKHGQGILVEVKGNSQLLYYGLGALIKLEAAGLDVEIIKLQVIQPRCNHPSGDVIRNWEIDVLELYEFAVRLKRAAKRTEDPNAPLNAGDHCRFCNVKATCPALTQLATVEAQDAFGVIDDKLKVPEDPEQLTKALSMIPMLETWCKAVKKHAYQELSSGRTVPGHKLVEKRARRNWISTAKTIEFLEKSSFAELDNFDEKIYEPAKLKSPSQIETSLGLTAQEKRELNSILVEKKSTGLTLVSNSDARPAVAAGAAVEFEIINEGETNE
jgi:hypothetical protein